MKKQFFKELIAGLCIGSMLLAGCGKAESVSVDTISENQPESVSETSVREIEKPEDLSWSLSSNFTTTLPSFAQLEDYDETKATLISISGDTVEITGDGAVCEGRRIIISQKGTYEITGESENARIVVDAPDEKVHLVLNQVTLHSEDGAVIYGKNAKKLSITSKEGTVNTLSDGVSHMDEDEKAAIYATCDLFLNGTGELIVNGNYKNGIATKDDLKIYHTSLSVNSVGHGLKGNDSVLLYKANVTVYAGIDGCRVSEEENPEKGNLVVIESYLYLTAEDDCMQVATAIILKDAEVICRCYDKIINCDGYLDGTDDIMVWR